MNEIIQDAEPKKRKFSEGGFSKEIQKYEEIMNPKTGKLELKATEKENFYNKIQEQVEDQLLDTIINRYKIDLHDKKITQLKEEIVDLTQMPTDLVEVYALAHTMEKQFNNSDAIVKNYFKDFGSYLKAFQNGTLRNDLEKIQMMNKQINEFSTQKTEPSTQKTEASIQKTEVTTNE